MIAHRLLCVVGAVAQAERGRRDQLHPPESAVQPVDALFAVEQPVDRDHDREAEQQADQWRQHDEHDDLLQTGRDERGPAGLRDGGAGHAADQRVDELVGRPRTR